MIGYQYPPLTGRQNLVVEFRKLLLQWRREGRMIPVSHVAGKGGYCGLLVPAPIA